MKELRCAIIFCFVLQRSEGDFDHWFGAYNVGEDGKSLNEDRAKLTRSLADYLEERTCVISCPGSSSKAILQLAYIIEWLASRTNIGKKSGFPSVENSSPILYGFGTRKLGGFFFFCFTVAFSRFGTLNNIITLTPHS